jgi:hypothetical protein
MTFTICKETYPIILNGLRIPQAEDAKYLGLSGSQTKLDKYIYIKRTHIFIKRKQLGF